MSVKMHQEHPWDVVAALPSRGDHGRIMSQASCLSPISNAMRVYNTLLTEEVLEEAKREGKIFGLEAISHVSPLAYRHVVVNGTYDFSRVGWKKL